MPGKVFTTHKLTHNSTLPHSSGTPQVPVFRKRWKMFDTRMGTPSTLSAPFHKVFSATHDDDHHQKGFHFVTLLPAVRLQQTDNFCHFVLHHCLLTALQADTQLGIASSSVSHPTDTWNYTRACKIHRDALKSAKITYTFQRMKVSL